MDDPPIEHEASFLAMNDGAYRYLLTRKIGAGKRTICWVMLNPSTADEQRNDPTLRRVIGFSQHGFDVVLVVNLYAKRATDPKDLFPGTQVPVAAAGSTAAAAPIASAVGPANDLAIAYAARRAEVVVCAWGAGRAAVIRQREAMEAILPASRRPPKCLGLTLDGFPRHPLYVRREQPLVPFVFPPARRSKS